MLIIYVTQRLFVVMLIIYVTECLFVVSADWREAESTVSRQEAAKSCQVWSQGFAWWQEQKVSLINAQQCETIMVLSVTYVNVMCLNRLPDIIMFRTSVISRHFCIYSFLCFFVSLSVYISVFLSVWFSVSIFIPPSVCVSLRILEMKRKAVERIEEQLMKLQVQATDREENKQISLGTSKLNYLDPRISVAWYLCGTAVAV